MNKRFFIFFFKLLSFSFDYIIKILLYKIKFYLLFQTYIYQLKSFIIKLSHYHT